MKFCHLQQHDGPKEYYAWWSKSDRERQILCDIIYLRNLKNKAKQKKAHRYRKQTSGYHWFRGVSVGD